MTRTREHLAVAAVAAIAVVAGVIARFAHAAPTGDTTVDGLLAGVGVALIVLIGATAPWWAVAVAAGVAGVIAIGPLLIVLALGALGLALWVGSTRRIR